MKLPFGFSSFRSYLTRFGDDVARISGKTKFRQSLEIVAAGFKGFSIKDYYCLPLYMGDGWDKLGSLQYDRLNFFLNKQCVGVVPFNKWVSENFFHGAGIPCVRSIGVYHRDFGMLRDGGALRTLDQVRKLYLDAGDDLVLKPVDEGMGAGVSVTSQYDQAKDTLSVNGKKNIPLTEFAAFLDDRQCSWVVQPRIRQHGDMATLHPSSLNTIRMVTLIDDNNAITPQFAILRMGAGCGSIDNSSAGGIFSVVNIDTGVAGKGQKMQPWLTYPEHPDTGMAINGFKVPFWEEVRTLAVSAHAVLPYPRDLGWDIAITERGPLIVEVNAYWSSDMFQRDNVNLSRMTMGKIYKTHFS